MGWKDAPEVGAPLVAGNIDLTKRPVVKNADGSISTVRSMSANFDGREVLIPTVSDDGRIMSDKEAIDTYRKSGRHLGQFKTPAEATAYAEKLHADQEQMYAQPSWSSAPEVGAKPSVGIKQTLGNAAAGLVRGAGSIGATLLAPIDMASDALAGKGLSLESNRERRAGMDAGLAALGADPTSTAYQVGKVGGEIAGTAGAGGVVANTLGRAGAASPNLLNAIRTSGMQGGSLGTRTAGGAIAGGATAGLVSPDDAGAGVGIGAALPGALQLAGRGGQALGQLIRGPQQTPDAIAAITGARQAGYVIPPTQANPTLVNRAMEGLAGKITTGQNASVKNQVVTNKLAAEALGLPGDTKLTPDVLTNIRQQAGQAYDAIGQTGLVTPGVGYSAALDGIEASAKKAAQGFPNAKPSPVLELVASLRSPTFDAASAVSKIKELRSAADDAFRTGNTDIARASKAGAKALEDALEDHLQATGQQALLDSFREGRKLIAKTYTVEKALNKETGTVAANKLAGELNRGKPLSDELKQIAQFGARFPKAAQTTEAMGSLPQLSPLDYAVAGGSLVGSDGNPLAALGLLARPAARATLLSRPVQNRLVQQPNALARLLGNDAVSQLGYRSAPVLMADQ